jgi:hypothetical protein
MNPSKNVVVTFQINSRVMINVDVTISYNTSRLVVMPNMMNVVDWMTTSTLINVIIVNKAKMNYVVINSIKNRLINTLF